MMRRQTFPDAPRRPGSSPNPVAGAPPRPTDDRASSLRRILLLVLCFVLLLSSVGLSAALRIEDAKTATPQEIEFTETATGGRLNGTWYKIGSNRGVVMAAGFGQDRGTLTAAATTFAQAGFDVFTFDFPGHGRSDGKLSMDDSSSERTSAVYGDAVAQFLQLTGLPSERVLLFGHSMGARSALRFASSTPARFGGLLLLGTSVDLLPGHDPDPFRTNDDMTQPWIARLGPGTPYVPIALISGAWDDILPPAAAVLLYERLSGEDATLFQGNRGDGPFAPLTWLSPDGRHLLSLHPYTFHLLETWTPSLLQEAVLFASDLLGTSPVPVSDMPYATRRIGLWGICLALLLAASLVASSLFRRQSSSRAGDAGAAPSVGLTRYLLIRLFLWVPGLLLAAAFAFLAWQLPFGLPALSLLHATGLGGCGLAGLLAARLLPRAAAPLGPPSGPVIPRTHAFGKHAESRGKALATGGLFLLFLITSLILWADNGWYYLVPANVRLLWIVVFTLWTVPGFLILLRETESFRAAATGPVANGLLLLLQFLPFLLIPIAFAILGSSSGAVGGIMALFALIPALAAGRAGAHAFHSPVAGAFFASATLQILIQVQGALLEFPPL